MVYISGYPTSMKMAQLPVPPSWAPPGTGMWLCRTSSSQPNHKVLTHSWAPKDSRWTQILDLAPRGSVQCLSCGCSCQPCFPCQTKEAEDLQELKAPWADVEGVWKQGRKSLHLNNRSRLLTVNTLPWDGSLDLGDSAPAPNPASPSLACETCHKVVGYMWWRQHFL